MDYTHEAPNGGTRIPYPAQTNVEYPTYVTHQTAWGEVTVDYGVVRIPTYSLLLP